MTGYFIITLNVLLGGRFNEATLSEVAPNSLLHPVGDLIQMLGLTENGDAAVGNFSLMHCLNFTTIIMGTLTTIWHVYGVLTTTVCRPRIASLAGLGPVALWWFIIWCVFWCTEFGFQYQGAVLIGLVPIYSLLT